MVPSADTAALDMVGAVVSGGGGGATVEPFVTVASVCVAAALGVGVAASLMELAVPAVAVYTKLDTVAALFKAVANVKVTWLLVVPVTAAVAPVRSTPVAA